MAQTRNVLLRGAAKPGKEGVAQYSADNHGFGHGLTAAAGIDLVEVGLGDQKCSSGIAGEPVALVPLAQTFESRQHTCSGEPARVVLRDVPALHYAINAGQGLTANVRSIDMGRNRSLRNPEGLRKRKLRIDRVDNASCRRNTEPADLQEATNQTQPPQVRLTVTRLIRPRPIAGGKQPFPQIELDGCNRDAAFPAQLSHSHMDSISIG